MTYTYETTYEDESPDGTVRVSAEVRITYTVNWGCPARIHYDENDHPAEPDELEVVKLEIEDVSYPSGKMYRIQIPKVDVWVENLREEMLTEARERMKERE